MSYMIERRKQALEEARNQQASAPSSTTQQASTQTPVSTPASTGQSSAYQQNLSTSSDKWYSGNIPTSREIYGRIATINQTDPKTAQQIAMGFAMSQMDPSSPYYAPYKKATNKAVSTLANMGIDTSNITDEWFDKYSYLNQYLIYNGTTNTPTKPGSKATEEQLAAYEYYQIGKAHETTKKAQQEWAALQEEVAYWTARSDYNYSDDQIIDKIYGSDFAKRYPTLAKMDESLNPGEAIVELNSAIDYSKDNLYTVIWRARNGGGTGSMDADTALSANGQGNKWKENQDIAAKLNFENEATYSPYSVGMTADEEGLYFNRGYFDQKWIDANRAYAVSMDETAQKMYTEVVKAERYTQKLESQLDELYDDLNYLLTYYEDADTILDFIKEDSSKYSALFELDESMSLGPKALKKTTRAVDYRWADIEQKVRDICDKKHQLTIVSGVVNTEGLQNQEALEQAMLDSVMPTIVGNGTDAEKTAATTGGMTIFDEAVAQLNASAEDYKEKFNRTVQEDIAGIYIPALRGIHDYEQHVSDRDKLQAELDNLDKELNPLKDRMDKIDPAAEMSPEAYAGLARAIEDEDWAYYSKILSRLDGSKVIDPNSPIYDPNQENLYNEALRFLYSYAYPNSSFDWDRVIPAGQALWDAIQPDEDPYQLAVAEAASTGNSTVKMQAPDGKTYDVSFIGAKSGDPAFVYAVDSETGEEIEDLQELKERIEPDRLSAEEAERYKMLSARREELEEAIKKEEQYLSDNEMEYKDALWDQNEIMTRVSEYAGEDSQFFPMLDYAFQVSQQNATPDWYAYNVYDKAVEDGEILKEEIPLYAYSSTVLSTSDADVLQGILDQANKLGVQFTPEERDSIQTQIDNLRRDAQGNAYLLLDSASDFDEVVEETRKKADKGEIQFLRMVEKAMNPNDSDLTLGLGKAVNSMNPLGRLLNAKDSAEKIIGANAMSEEEYNRFLYLYGAEGEEAAQRYLNLLFDPDYGMITVRASQNTQEAVSHFASSNWWNAAAATTASFVTNVLGGTESAAYIAGKLVSGDKVSPYNRAFTSQNVTSSAREGAKNYFVKAAGGGESVGGKVVDIFFDGVTSMVDSQINAAMMGNFLDDVSGFLKETKLGRLFSGELSNLMANKDSKLGQFLSKTADGKGVAGFVFKAGKDLVHASSMGLSAAASAYREAIIKGGSEDQALMMAFATFLAETGSEAITVGNIHEAFAKGGEEATRSLADFVKTLFKEGFEEFLGEGVNEYVGQNADRIIMGAMSEYEQNVQKFLDMHYPETVARQLADQQMWSDILRAGVVGFISSNVGTTFNYAQGALQESDRKLSTVADESLKKVTAVVQEQQQQQPLTAEQIKEQELIEKRFQQEEAAEAQYQKDATILKDAFDATPRAAAVAITATLSNGNIPAEKAAAQYLVSQMAGGNANLAAKTMYSILNVGRGMYGLKADIVYASLTTGAGHEALNAAIKKTQNGEMLTLADVKAIQDGIQEDRENNPDFKAQFADNVKASRIANRTAELMQQKEAEIKQAETDEKEADALVAEADAKLKEAQEKLDKEYGAVDAAVTAVTNAVESQLSDAGNTDHNGEVQQSLNHLDGTDEKLIEKAEAAVKAAEAAAAEAQEKAEQAKKDANETKEKALTEARLQAQQEVEQELDQEAQEEFNAAVQKYNPAIPFSKPVAATVAETGEVVEIIGVFSGDPSGAYMFATKNGYIRSDQLDANSWDKASTDALVGAVNGGNANNPVQPVMWMPHSLEATLDGTDKTVTLVGFAGKQDDGFDDYLPVVMDSEGNVYDVDQFHLKQDPFTLTDGNSALLGMFNNLDQTNLPEFTKKDLFKAQHPDVQLPEEDFSMYPDGPVTVTASPFSSVANGTVNIVGAVIPSDEIADIRLITDTGEALAVNDVGALPDDLTDWISAKMVNKGISSLDLEDVDFSDLSDDDDIDLEDYEEALSTTPDVNEEASEGESAYPGAVFIEKEPANGVGETAYILAPNEGFSVKARTIYGVDTEIIGMRVMPSGKAFFVSKLLTPYSPDEITTLNDTDFLKWAMKQTGEKLLNPETGYALSPGNVQSFVDEVQKLLNNQKQPTVEAKPAKDADMANLKDWQDPKYHGKVAKTTKKTNPKTSKFKKWFNLENVPEAARKYLVDENGAPRVYFRGFGDFGKTLYNVHQSKGISIGDGKTAYVNFYMSDKDTAAKYAGTGKIAHLRYIKNWETAKAAMQDIGYDLIEKKNSAGQWGYQVVDGSGSPVSGKQSTWFAENELKRFRMSYGGGLQSDGIHAGYITMKNPLIIDGIHTNYSDVEADVTAPDGSHYSGSHKTRVWAQWAFAHGYDAVIFDEVQDNPSGYGGNYGVEIVTSQPEMFKSVYNSGNWSSTDPDIMAYKAPVKGKTNEQKLNDAVDQLRTQNQSPQLKEVNKKLTEGKPVEEMTPEERKALADEIDALPEVQKLKEQQHEKATTLSYSQSYAIKMFDGTEKAYNLLYQTFVPVRTIELLETGASYYKAIESLFTPEAVEEQHRVRDKMAYEQGSAVFDEKGKAHYNGKVRQDKRLDVLLGLPASGKSTLADAISAEYGSRPLDNDDAKKFHKDYADGANSSPLHNESRFITEQAMHIMIGNGDNVVMPVVGHSFSSVNRQIQAFKAAGYDVHLHNVQLPWSKAISRTLNRMVEDNRLLSIPYITGTDDTQLSPEKINNTFDRFVKEGIVDGYAVWNNDVERGKPPVATAYSEIGETDLRTGAFGRVVQTAGNRAGGRGSNGNPGGLGQVSGGNIQALSVRPQTPTEIQANKIKAKYSPYTIAKNLVKALGVGDYIGARRFGVLPSRVLGYYETRARYIGVRAKDAGSLEVTFHEIGHALAAKYGLIATDQMVNNLPSDFADAYTPDQLRDEAMAEFMWRYMANEDLARQFAGDGFYDQFEGTLRGTPDWNAVQTARNQLQMWLEASVSEKIGATIHNRDAAQKLSLHKFVRNAVDSLVDNTSAAKEFDRAVQELAKDAGVKLNVLDRVRAQALRANTAGKQATSILTGSGLTDANGNLIGPSYADAIAATGFRATEENMDLLVRYMLACHSLDRDNQNKPVFDSHITKEAREAFIHDVETNHAVVAKAAEAHWDFHRKFMQEFMVNTGRLSQEAFDAMNQMYPHYVPTYRVQEADGITQRIGKSKTFRVQRAKGSTQDIYNPIDSWFGMVSSIVTQNALNRAALAFDRMYQQFEGLGTFAHQVIGANEDAGLTPKQQEIYDLVGGMVDAGTMNELLSIVGNNRRNNNPVASGGTLDVIRPDGTVVQYQFEDMELFKLLAGVNNKTSNAALDAIGFITRGMSALTTGSNPIFAARNFMRDFQNSVNYGNWASNYGSGVLKWLAAAYEVWKGSDNYNDYVALGGGGWTRIDPSRKATRNELYSGAFKGYSTANVGRTVKWAGKKVWNAITLARLNEIVEQTSRFAEYRYGGHNLKTEAGRVEGYLAAQEATVDFNRSGNSGLSTMLKKLIPFFNASAQGVYRTSRMLTQEEIGRAPARFAKTVINTAFMSALCSGILLKYLKDDDKEEFEYLSDDMKSKHFYLPNFAPGILGEAPLIRIPLAQDPLTYAIHGVVTNAMWNGTTEGPVIDLAATVNTILDNLNPLGSGTILAPVLSINANKSWYGSRIVPSYLERNKYAPDQYTEETPDVFISAGRWLNMSPLKVQYLAEQYTGFLGQLVIPAISKDATGETGGLKAAINAARKRFTSDPLISNDIVSSFYDAADTISTVIDEANRGIPLNILRRGLTEEEAVQAYKDAKALNSGLISDTKNKINALYDEIDGINANPTLTDEDRYKMTSERRKQILDLALDANEKLAEFTEEYVTGDNLLIHALTSGTQSHIPTADEELHTIFKGDETEDYMQRAYSVYNNSESSGYKKAAALPHPSTEFTLTDVSGNEIECEISEDELDRYTAFYRDAYRKYVMTSDKGKHWDTLSDKDQYQVLKSAAAAGNAAVKKAYAREHGIKTK